MPYNDIPLLNRPELKRKPLTKEELKYYTPMTPLEEARMKGVDISHPDFAEEDLEEHSKQVDEPTETEYDISRSVMRDWRPNVQDDMYSLGRGLAIDHDTMAWLYGLRSLGVPLQPNTMLQIAGLVPNLPYHGALAWMNENEWERVLLALRSLPPDDAFEYGSTPDDLLASIHSMGLPSDVRKPETMSIVKAISSVDGPYRGVAQAIVDMEDYERAALANQADNLILHENIYREEEALSQDDSDANTVVLIERSVPSIVQSPGTGTRTTKYDKKRLLVYKDEVLPTDKVLKENATVADRDDLVDVVRYVVVKNTMPDEKDPDKYVEDDPSVMKQDLRIPRSEMGPDDYLVKDKKQPTDEEFLKSKGYGKSRSKIKPDRSRFLSGPPAPTVKQTQPDEDVSLADVMNEVGMFIDELEGDAPLSAPKVNESPAVEPPKEEAPPDPRQEVIAAVPDMPSEVQDVSGTRNKGKAMTEFMNNYESLSAGFPKDVKVYDDGEALPIPVLQQDKPLDNPNEVPATTIRGCRWVVSRKDNVAAIVIGVTPDNRLAVRKFPSGVYDEWDVVEKEVRLSNSQGNRTIRY